jgi:hypothetical protein
VFGFIVGTSKEWIHLVKGRGWVFELAQDDSAIDIAQQCFLVLGFIREPAIIDKYILRLLTLLGFIRYPNRR